VNKDGKMDVLNGEYWYEAPDWTPHEMKPPTDYKDGLRNYSTRSPAGPTISTATASRTSSSSTSPATPASGSRTPRARKGTEEAHHLALACNETPAYVDLFGTGKRVLPHGLPAAGKGNEGQMAYFTPNPKDRRRVMGDAPDQRKPSTPAEIKDGKPVPEPPRKSRARRSSATGSASETSTATAART